MAVHASVSLCSIVSICSKTDVLFLQTVKQYPSLVQSVIKKLLPRLKNQDRYKLLERSDFSGLVRSQLTVPRVVEYTIEDAVDYLHASGQVYS